MSLKIESRVVHGVTIVTCTGRIVFGEESGIFRQSIKDLLPTSPRIVVNLASVSYIDSGGLGTMVGVYSSARAAGADVKLSGLNSRLHEVLHITKLVTVFEIYDTEQQAIDAFAKKPL